MSVLYVISRTHDVYWYKSVKSSSGKERVVHVKYESLGQTTRTRQTSCIQDKCEQGLSLTQGQG
jgi:hypothetical protein